MSNDYLVHPFFGFEVNEPDLYTRKEVVVDHKYCRECGQQMNKTFKDTVARLKDEVVNAIIKKYRDFSDDDESECLFDGHEYVLGNLDGNAVSLFQVNFGEPVVVAGVGLGVIDAIHEGVVVEEARQVNEKKLAAFLRKKKIPLKPGTFKMYMMVEIC